MSYSDVKYKGQKESEDDERLMLTITDGLQKLYELKLTYAYLEKHR